MSTSRKCSALKSDGQPCRAWARRDGDPPLCAAHSDWDDPKKKPNNRRSEAITENNLTTGIVNRRYSLEDIAELLNKNADFDLKDELTTARVAVRWLVRHLEEELTPHEFAHLAGVIFTGTNSIVRLLQAQQDLGEDEASEIARAFNQALDELSQELGLQL